MASSEKFNLIPIDGPRADALLEHINVDHWGRGRPAELLRLVAYLSDYPQFTPVRPWQIRGLGRTQRQARYDHQVMVGLASDRVLQRVQTRRGDVWRVNPDLRHWRGVPGIPSWRRVVSLFSDPLSDICARPGPNRAGQRPRSWPCWPPEMDVEGVPLSATDLASRAHNMARGARRPGTTPPEPGAPGARGAAPHYAFRSSLTTFENFPHSGAREGASGDDADKAGRRLLEAVEAVVESPILGVNRRRIHEVGARLANRIDELLSHVPELKAIRTGSGAAAAVEQLAASLPEWVDQAEARRRALEAQISAWERAGADPEDIDRLKSQLKDLGEE